MSNFNGIAKWSSWFERFFDNDNTKRLTPPSQYMEEKHFRAIYPDSEFLHERDMWERLKFRTKALAVPFSQARKDFFDTAKPYKSRYHLKRDLLYPIQGLKHLGEAILTLIATPFDFMFNMYFAFNEYAETKKKSAFATPFLMASVNIFHSSIFAVRAATQLLATPLVWLRAIVRSAITSRQGQPHVNESKTVQRAYNYYRSNFSDPSMKVILDLLHYKHSKALNCGQPTIDVHVEKTLYKNALKEKGQACDDYVNCFRPSAPSSRLRP